jgi:hypothetical protein
MSLCGRESELVALISTSGVIGLPYSSNRLMHFELKLLFRIAIVICSLLSIGSKFIKPK